MAPLSSPSNAVAIWLAASRMLQRGSRVRSAQRMLLGLLALYAFVIACPDLAVGTSLKRIAAEDARRDAHFVAWHTGAPTVAALMRSPRPRQTVAPQTARETAADPVELSRPSDPLTRLDQTHLAQYGGDLEALTGPDPEPQASAGQ